MTKNFLRAVVALLLLACNVSSHATPVTQPDDAAASIYFCGLRAFSTNGQATNFNRLISLPESKAFGGSIVEKLSTAPFRGLKNRMASPATNAFAGDFRLLFNDLFASETYIEFNDVTRPIPQATIAIHLNPEHINYWKTTLSNIFQTWTAIHPTPVQASGAIGWQLKKHVSPDTVACLSTKDWLILGWGDGAATGVSTFAARLQTAAVPWHYQPQAWLQLKYAGKGLERFAPTNLPFVLFPGPIPAFDVRLVQGGNNFVKLTAEMEFDHPLALKLQPWKIPTELIHGDTISLMAIRSAEGWLAVQPWFHSMNLRLRSDQMYCWAAANPPFDETTAFPITGASNFLFSIKDSILNRFNNEMLPKNFGVHLDYSNNIIHLKNFPLLSAYMGAYTLASGDFLTAGMLMPNLHGGTPMQPGLLKELKARTNMVAYSWELTDPHTINWQTILAASRVLTTQSFPVDHPGDQWLSAIHQHLGNTVNELTWTAPNRLFLKRNATIGLGSLELNLLEYWVDSPQFPFAPAYPKVTPRRPTHQTSAPQN